MKRPRHDKIIEILSNMRVNINYITDGDIAGALSVIGKNPKNDIYYSTGGGPEGVLAAAAHYALDHHRDRLAEDHENAQTLAFGLAEIPGIKLNPKNVETNIIFFELENVNASSLAEKLEQHSILVEVVETDLIRVVTNLMVDEKQILIVLETIQSEMSQLN